MKRNYVVVIVAVILAIASIIGLTFATEADNSFVPEIIMENPDREFNDEHEIHMWMYMTMPDYGDVIIKIAVSRDDTSAYGNSGEAKAYTRDGEYIDEIGGSVVVDYSSCETIEDMNLATYNHAAHYDYKNDAEEGIFYEKIYIW